MVIFGIGSHPDDLEIQCFGTLAKHAANGDTVYTCSVANGCYGHYEIMPKELAEVRCKEASISAEMIGAKYFPAITDDLAVESSDKLQQRKLTDLIRQVNPDIIITHSDNDYMRDHIETFKLVEYASFAATIPHYITEHPHTNAPVPIYQMDNYMGFNFDPTKYVDITDFIEIKKKALGCHKSQYEWLKEHDDCDYINNMLIAAKFRGMQFGVGYAEGFRMYNRALRMAPDRL